MINFLREKILEYDEIVKSIIKIIRRIKLEYKKTFLNPTNWLQDLVLGISKVSKSVNEHLSNQQLFELNDLFVDFFDSKTNDENAFKNLKSELKCFNSQMKRKWDILMSSEADSIFLNATAIWLSPALIYQRAIQNSANFVFFVMEQSILSYDTLEEMSQLLIEIHGDLNRLPFMGEIIIRFENLKIL